MSATDLDPEALAAVTRFAQRLVDGTVCVHCGRAVKWFVQVGRSYYAEPCRHRQGQGRAAYFNSRILEKHRRLVRQAEGLHSTLEDYHRRMTEPDDDFEAMNDALLEAVENCLVLSSRRLERRRNKLAESGGAGTKA